MGKSRLTIDDLKDTLFFQEHPCSLVFNVDSGKKQFIEDIKREWTINGQQIKGNIDEENIARCLSIDQKTLSSIINAHSQQPSYLLIHILTYYFKQFFGISDDVQSDTDKEIVAGLYTCMVAAQQQKNNYSFTTNGDVAPELECSFHLDKLTFPVINKDPVELVFDRQVSFVQNYKFVDKEWKLQSITIDCGKKKLKNLFLELLKSKNIKDLRQNKYYINYLLNGGIISKQTELSTLWGEDLNELIEIRKDMLKASLICLQVNFDRLISGLSYDAGEPNGWSDEAKDSFKFYFLRIGRIISILESSASSNISDIPHSASLFCVSALTKTESHLDIKKRWDKFGAEAETEDKEEGTRILLSDMSGYLTQGQTDSSNIMPLLNMADSIKINFNQYGAAIIARMNNKCDTGFSPG